MTINVNELTKVEAVYVENFEDRVASNLPHIPFKNLEGAKVVEVHYDKDLYEIVGESNFEDMIIVHRLTKKGERDKRKESQAIYKCRVTAFYKEETQAKELEVEITIEKDEPTMTNEITWTLEELETMDYMGLAKTQSAIDEVLECGKRENDFYVGTNVKNWLESMTIMTENDMIEQLSVLDDECEIIEHSYRDHVFIEKSHDNSYNWSGNSSKDIDYRLLEDEHGNMYAYVRIHIGQDIRAGYTDGILIDLETESDECFINFVDRVNEYGEGGYITIEGIDYSIDGDILGECLTVYSHKTHDTYEVATACYCWSQEEYDKELEEIVLEAIKKD